MAAVAACRSAGCKCVIPEEASHCVCHSSRHTQCVTLHDYTFLPLVWLSNSIAPTPVHIMPSVATVSQTRIRSSVQVQEAAAETRAGCSRKRPVDPDLTLLKMEPDSDATSDSCDKPRRKRQRLDHLSQEEKVMRRKLKNRVAAQYARDRKKVLVDEMAITISDLRRDKQQLSHENDLLKSKNHLLMQEIDRLKQALAQAGGRVPDPTDEKTSESAALTNDRQPRDQVLSKVGSDSRPTCQQPESSSSNNNFFSCLLLTMASLTIASSQLTSTTMMTTNSSARTSVSGTRGDHFTKCSVKSLNVDPGMFPEGEDGDRRDGQWWGSHQQNWNPAKIHMPYVQ